MYILRWPLCKACVPCFLPLVLSLFCALVSRSFILYTPGRHLDMAILLRFNTFLRGKNKTCKTIEERKFEGTVEAVSVKDVTYFFTATSADSEWVYLDDLSKAAHHPQVLSLRHSLKLGAVADFHVRNNICRIFKGALRVPPPSIKECTPSAEPPMPTSLPEEPFVPPIVEDAALTPSVEDPVSLLTIEDAAAPSTPLPEYIEAIPELDQPLALGTADTKLSVIAPRNTRPLRITDFAEVGYLGRGAWGYVHLHRHRGTGMLVAIKSIQKKRVQGKEDQLLREQATLLAASGQEGVLDLLGSFQDGAYFYLVTRYYAGGDLLCMMEELGTPPEDLLVFYAAQLLVCIERIHARGAVHRDIKPANIFLDRKGNLVLGDFGLAIFLNELQHAKHVEFCGTMEYLSRDVWQGKQYSCASDVWAYGAVVFEMAVGRRMWDANMCKSIRHARDKAIGGSVREFLGKDTISHDLMHFLDEIFENDDYDRPTLTALKRHKFFESM
ncbi:hypothetical protein PHLGIDRAFT_458453 [Phlebiopsis gigantea 11061_1 CR5-6]|uniref:non-specific serine/threonine protein kinase n=1 Tax=Phlebiopsis gigantea (strain 11061_1 CR5-6) TaxID=745531 RepID=A0A0C3P1E5_PHLG1|nr:hypothetical protein PHLGIDRAFT_458453 [Phlebiopsis gigantea 11061_1 CR5-6]